jgi:hypothetical protein
MQVIHVPAIFDKHDTHLLIYIYLRFLQRRGRDDDGQKVGALSWLRVHLDLPAS